MPADLFTASCQKHANDIERVAADFAVSVDAAKTRKAALGA
jgi:predicted transcriptional regulator